MLLKFTFVSDNFALLQGFFAPFSSDKAVEFRAISSSNKFELTILSDKHALEIVNGVIAFAGNNQLSSISLLSEGATNNNLRESVIQSFIRTYTGKKKTKITRTYLTFVPRNPREIALGDELDREVRKARNGLQKKTKREDDAVTRAAEKAREQKEKEKKEEKAEGKGKVTEATAMGGVAEPEDEDSLVHSGSRIVVHGKAVSPLGSVVGSSSSGSVEEKVPEDVPGELTEVLKRAVILADQRDCPNADIINYLYEAEKKYSESCREQNRVLAGRKSRFERGIEAFHRAVGFNGVLQSRGDLLVVEQFEEFEKIGKAFAVVVAKYPQIASSVSASSSGGAASSAASAAKVSAPTQPLWDAFQCHGLLEKLDKIKFVVSLSQEEEAAAGSDLARLRTLIDPVAPLLVIDNADMTYLQLYAALQALEGNLAFHHYLLASRFSLIAQIKSPALREIILTGERSLQDAVAARLDDGAVLRLNQSLTTDTVIGFDNAWNREFGVSLSDADVARVKIAVNLSGWRTHLESFDSSSASCTSSIVECHGAGGCPDSPDGAGAASSADSVQQLPQNEEAADRTDWKQSVRRKTQDKFDDLRPFVMLHDLIGKMEESYSAPTVEQKASSRLQDVQAALDLWKDVEAQLRSRIVADFLAAILDKSLREILTLSMADVTTAKLFEHGMEFLNVANQEGFTGERFGQVLKQLGIGTLEVAPVLERPAVVAEELVLVVAKTRDASEDTKTLGLAKQLKAYTAAQKIRDSELRKLFVLPVVLKRLKRRAIGTHTIPLVRKFDDYLNRENDGRLSDGLRNLSVADDSGGTSSAIRVWQSVRKDTELWLAKAQKLSEKNPKSDDDFSMVQVLSGQLGKLSQYIRERRHTVLDSLSKIDVDSRERDQINAWWLQHRVEQALGKCCKDIQTAKTDLDKQWDDEVCRVHEENRLTLGNFSRDVKQLVVVKSCLQQFKLALAGYGESLPLSYDSRFGAFALKYRGNLESEAGKKCLGALKKMYEVANSVNYAVVERFFVVPEVCGDLESFVKSHSRPDDGCFKEIEDRQLSDDHAVAKAVKAIHLIDATCEQVAQALTAKFTDLFRKLTQADIEHYSRQKQDRSGAAYNFSEYAEKLSSYVGNKILAADGEQEIPGWLTIAYELYLHKNYAGFVAIMSGLSQVGVKVKSWWNNSANNSAKTQLVKLKWLAINLQAGVEPDMSQDNWEDKSPQLDAVVPCLDPLYSLTANDEMLQRVQRVILGKVSAAPAAAAVAESVLSALQVFMRGIEAVKVDYETALASRYFGSSIAYASIPNRALADFLCSPDCPTVEDLRSKLDLLDSVNGILSVARRLSQADLAFRLAGVLEIPVPESVAHRVKQEALLTFIEQHSPLLALLIRESGKELKAQTGRTYEAIDRLVSALNPLEIGSVLDSLKLLEIVPNELRFSGNDFATLLTTENGVINCLNVRRRTTITMVDASIPVSEASKVAGKFHDEHEEFQRMVAEIDRNICIVKGLSEDLSAFIKEKFQWQVKLEEKKKVCTNFDGLAQRMNGAGLVLFPGIGARKFLQDLVKKESFKHDFLDATYLERLQCARRLQPNRSRGIHDYEAFTRESTIVLSAAAKLFYELANAASLDISEYFSESYQTDIRRSFLNAVVFLFRMFVRLGKWDDHSYCFQEFKKLYNSWCEFISDCISKGISEAAIQQGISLLAGRYQRERVQLPDMCSLEIRTGVEVGVVKDPNTDILLMYNVSENKWVLRGVAVDSLTNQFDGPKNYSLDSSTSLGNRLAGLDVATALSQKRSLLKDVLLFLNRSMKKEIFSDKYITILISLCTEVIQQIEKNVFTFTNEQLKKLFLSFGKMVFSLDIAYSKRDELSRLVHDDLVALVSDRGKNYQVTVLMEQDSSEMEGWNSRVHDENNVLLVCNENGTWSIGNGELMEIVHDRSELGRGLVNAATSRAVTMNCSREQLNRLNVDDVSARLNGAPKVLAKLQNEIAQYLCKIKLFKKLQEILPNIEEQPPEPVVMQAAAGLAALPPPPPPPPPGASAAAPVVTVEKELSEIEQSVDAYCLSMGQPEHANEQTFFIRGERTYRGAAQCIIVLESFLAKAEVASVHGDRIKGLLQKIQDATKDKIGLLVTDLCHLKISDDVLENVRRYILKLKENIEEGIKAVCEVKKTGSDKEYYEQCAEVFATQLGKRIIELEHLKTLIEKRAEIISRANIVEDSSGSQVQELLRSIDELLDQYNKNPVLQDRVAFSIREIYHWAVVSGRLAESRGLNGLTLVNTQFPDAILLQIQQIMCDQTLLLNPKYLCYMVNYLESLAYFLLFDGKGQIRASMKPALGGQEDGDLFDAYVVMAIAYKIKDALREGLSRGRKSMGVSVPSFMTWNAVLTRNSPSLLSISRLQDFRGHKLFGLMDYSCEVIGDRATEQQVGDAPILPHLTSDDRVVTPFDELYYSLMISADLRALLSKLPENVRWMFEEHLPARLKQEEDIQTRIAPTGFSQLKVSGAVKKSLGQAVLPFFERAVASRAVPKVKIIDNIAASQPVSIAECLRERAQSYTDAAKFVLRKFGIDRNYRKTMDFAATCIDSVCQQFIVSSSQSIPALLDELSEFLATVVESSVSLGGKLDANKAREQLVAAESILNWKRKRSPVITIFSQNDKIYIQIEEPVGRYTLEEICEYLEIFAHKSRQPLWYKMLPEITQKFLSDELYQLYGKLQEKFAEIEARKDLDEVDRKKAKIAAINETAGFVEEFNATLNIPLPSNRKVPGLANGYKHTFIVLDKDGKEELRSSRIRSAALAPFEVWNRFSGKSREKVRRKLTLQNLKQLLETELKQCAQDFIATWGAGCIAQGSDLTYLLKISLLAQTLFSPVKWEMDRVVEESESRMNSDKEQAIADLKAELESGNFKLEMDVEQSGSATIKVAIKPEFFSTNHAVNYGRKHPSLVAGKLEVEQLRTKQAVVVAAESFFANIAKWLVDQRINRPSVLGMRDSLVAYETRGIALANILGIIKQCKTDLVAATTPENKVRLDDINLVLDALNTVLPLVESEKFTSNWGAWILVAFEQIILDKAGLCWSTCKSGKDRTGASELYTDAMLAYYAEHKNFAGVEIDAKGKITVKRDFIDIFVDLLMSQHQQQVASQSTAGVYWLKSLRDALPDEVYKEICKRLGEDEFKTYAAIAKLNKPDEGKKKIFILSERENGYISVVTDTTPVAGASGSGQPPVPSVGTGSSSSGDSTHDSPMGSGGSAASSDSSSPGTTPPKEQGPANPVVDAASGASVAASGDLYASITAGYGLVTEEHALALVVCTGNHYLSVVSTPNDLAPMPAADLTTGYDAAGSASSSAIPPAVASASILGKPPKKETGSKSDSDLYSRGGEEEKTPLISGSRAGFFVVPSYRSSLSGSKEDGSAASPPPAPKST